MDARDFLIIGAVGVGAWWLWRRSRGATAPIEATAPGNASSYTPGAAASTETGPARLAGLIHAPSFGGLSPGFGMRTGAAAGGFSNALLLAAKDNVPVPTPPVVGAAPQFYGTITGVKSPPRGGTSSMGPEPLPLINPNRYGRTL